MAATNYPQYVDGAAEAVGLSSVGLGRLSWLLDRYVDGGRYAGVVSMVARRDRVVHCETHGLMDIEAGRAMQPDAIFRIASLTKPIASVALMTLYEEGRFQLDDPVARYIPQFAELRVLAGGTADQFTTRPPSRSMTIRDLLTHTSGLVGGGPANVAGELYHRAGLRVPNRMWPAVPGTIEAMVETLATLPLDCDPGAEWNYGVSTDVIGYLCEVLSGVPFDEFLRRRIFEPLGMPDTGFSVAPAKAERLAAAYRFTPEGPTPLALMDAPAASPFLGTPTFFSGNGGLASTVPDYLRFARMLARGGELDGARILGSRTLRLMTANHLPEGRDIAAMGQPEFGGKSMAGTGFGLGFAVLLDPVRAGVVGTPGEYYWVGGYSTFFFVSPGEDLVALCFAQLSPWSSYPIEHELRATIYGAIID